MPRLFVDKVDVEGATGAITGAELEHLRVLRLRPGDALVLFDSAGVEHEARIDSYTNRAAEVRIIRSYRPERESFLEVTLAQCVGKGEKMDWVVEKAVELGVQTIVPVLSTYTIPRLEGTKISKRRSRWAKIVLSAAKQSGRTSVPEIADITGFADFVGRAWPHELKLMFWEGESSQGLVSLRRELANPRSVLLLIGPEGGFTDAEVKEAAQNGFRTIKLGKRILRTETAAIAAVAVVQSLWGDMG
ncbi:MAG: 16S rRNA (uracil(1498)-N(3))-methyltransferase [Candidatus Binatia bacterium]